VERKPEQVGQHVGNEVVTEQELVEGGEEVRLIEKPQTEETRRYEMRVGGE
jgi:hypothetical protein